MCRSLSEPSVSGSVEGRTVSSPAVATEEAGQVEDIPVDRSRMAQRIPPAQEEQPSTSSGLQIDRALQERHEVSQGLSVLIILYYQSACTFQKGPSGLGS